MRRSSATASAMLVEGTRDITTGYLHDLSGMAIAERLKADVVLVSTAQPGDLDKIAMLKPAHGRATT